jgi:hypothetical protein
LSYKDFIIQNERNHGGTSSQQLTDLKVRVATTTPHVEEGQSAKERFTFTFNPVQSTKVLEPKDT